MKAKKKPRGIKQKIREEKKRKQLVLASAVAILIAAISVSGFLANSMLNQAINPPYQFKAAIVDHLSLTYPNQTFIEVATNTLEQAGYSVDYYPGENVTVEFYRNLPTYNYGLIILRVHSVTYKPEMPYTGLFSSESYTKTKYVYEQLTDQVQQVQYYDGGPTYFAISSKFVQQSMKGRFANSIIVMMGCNGLTYTDMARAFVEKGAKVYIGWSTSVSASHTDIAITSLLPRFLIEKLTLKQAVQETFLDVGFDPAFNSLLIYYPPEVGEQTIEDIAGNQTATL